MNAKESVSIEFGICDIDPDTDKDLYEWAVNELASILYEMDWRTRKSNDLVIDGVKVRLGFSGGNDYWFAFDEDDGRICARVSVMELADAVMEMADAVLTRLRSYLNKTKEPMEE